MSIPIIQSSINPVFMVKFPPHEGTKLTLKNCIKGTFYKRRIKSL